MRRFSDEVARAGVGFPCFLPPVLEVGSESLQGQRGQIAQSALQEICGREPSSLRRALQTSFLVFSPWD